MSRISPTNDDSGVISEAEAVTVLGILCVKYGFCCLRCGTHDSGLAHPSRLLSSRTPSSMRKVSTQSLRTEPCTGRCLKKSVLPSNAALRV